MLIRGIRLLKYVLIPNISLEIKSKKEYLREWYLLVFDVFKQTEIKEMFPPVFKRFLFYKSSGGFIMLGIFRYSPNT